MRGRCRLTRATVRQALDLLRVVTLAADGVEQRGRGARLEEAAALPAVEVLAAIRREGEPARRVVRALQLLNLQEVQVCASEFQEGRFVESSHCHF